MLTVVLLCLLLCVVYAVRAQVKARSAYTLPPSFPGELPIIGHTHILIVSGSKDFWSLIKRLSEFAVEKGGVIYCQVLQDLYYIITDPEDALTVANSCLQKHFIYDFVKNWLGQGIFTSSGEINKRHRKLLWSRFAAPTVHTFLKIFNDHAKKLVDEVNYFCGKGPFDPSTIIKHMVLQTSFLTTFGPNIKDVNFMKNYGAAVDEIMEMYINRFTKPYLRNNLIYRLLGHKRQEDILVNTMTELTNKVIYSKKAVIKTSNIGDNHPDLINNPDTFKSLVDYMLELDGLLTDKEIKEELDTNILASYDTIVHTLINMMVLLGSHSKVQDRIYEEFIEVLGGNRDVEKDDLQKLVYTKAVIKETLRVLPTGPVFGRYVDREVKLKNYTLPAKSHCMILPYGIHRSPAWGLDADQFRPERWLDPATLPADTNYFAAFSMGKRSCPGMAYGITQLAVVLAHLVRQSKWTTNSARLKMQFSVTLQSTGYEISVERRTTDE